jgi:CRP/FNR family transcriptional regulator, cyclic AMP receptor protein
MDPDPKIRPDPHELARMPLFESLSEEQLKAVASLAKVVRVEAGRRLIGAGTPGYSFFVVQEGAVSVTSGDEQLAELGPGDFFGEIALLGEGERTATVTTTSPVRLMVMTQSDFRVFARDWPEAAAVMEQTMAERLERGGDAAGG